MKIIKNDFDLKYQRDKKKNEMDFIVLKDNKIIFALESKSGGKYT